MRIKNIVYIALTTALLLLIPVFGNHYIEGWNWSPFDFVFMGALIFGVGFLFELARVKAKGNNAYKLASTLALLGLFFLIWVNGAVGIIGDSDINLLYAFVILTLFIGTIIAQLKPLLMSRVLFLAAFVQFIIPIIAFIVKTPDLSPGVLQVFVLNGFWVMMFVGSGILFRQANATQNNRGLATS